MAGDPYADLTGGPQQPQRPQAPGDPYADLTGGSSASADPYADLTGGGDEGTWQTIKHMAGQAIHHPIDTAVGMAENVVTPFVKGILGPTVEEAERLATHPDIGTIGVMGQYGGENILAMTPEARASLAKSPVGFAPQTDADLRNEAAQAVTTALSGGIGKAAAAKLGGGFIARRVAGVGVGAGAGAIFSPEHRKAGALVGAFLGGTFGTGRPEGAAPETVESIAAKHGVDPGALKAQLAYGATSPDVLVEQMKTNQGFTVNPRTGAGVTDGFAVGGLAKRGEGTVLSVTPESLTPKMVSAHLASMSTLFHDNPNVTYGGWVNPETGMVEIEPGEVFPRLGTALVRGAEVGEQAVYDIKGQETIPVPDLEEINDLASEAGVDKETAAEILYKRAKQAASTDETPSAPGAPSGTVPPGEGSAPGASGAGDHGPEGVDQGGVERAAGPEPGEAQGDGGGLVPRPPANGTGGGGGGGAGEPPTGGVGPSDFYGDDHDPVNLDDYLNRAKIVTGDPVAQAAIDVNLSRAAAAHGPKVRISHAETLQAAKDILNDPDAARELADGLGHLDRPQAVAALLTIRRNALAMSGLARAFKDGATKNPQEVEAAFQALSDAQERIMGRLIKTRSEFGRQLNALKIAASQTTDPTFWLLKARRVAGRQLSPEEWVDIQRRLDRVRETQGEYDRHPSSVNLLKRNQARQLLASGVENLKDISGFRKASTVYRAFLLSSAHTLAGAAIGHAAWGVMHAVDETLVGALDHAIGGMVTHLNATDMPLASGLAARWRGLKMSFEQAKSLIRTGAAGEEAVIDERPEFKLEKVGDTGLTLAAKKVAAAPVRVVLRLYGVVPQLVRGQAYQYELESELRAAIRRDNPGINAGRLKSEVVRLKTLGEETPMTDGALKNAGLSKTKYLHERELVAKAKQNAALKADEAGLTQRNIMTDLVNHAKREIEERAPAGRLLADMAVPFTTVPTNIAVQAAEHTPLTAAFGLRNLAKLVEMARDPGVADDVKLALQRKVAEQLVKAGTGSAAMALGYYLAEKRLLSGPSADSKAQRDTRMLAGEQPNSLLLDGSWFSDAKLAPVANMIELGGILHTALNDDRLRSPWASAAYVAKKFGAEMADAPYFDGMQHAVRALEEPGSFASDYVEEVAKGIVPNALARVEYAHDPYRREVDDSSFLTMIGQTVQSRIPGLAARLPVERNQFGEPIVHPTGLVTYFNPFPSMADRSDDPAVRVLLESGTNVARLPREPGETEAEYETRQERFGHYLHDYLTRLALSPGYQSLPAVAQRLMVREPQYFGDSDEGRLTTALRYMTVSRVVNTIRDHAGRFIPATGRMPKALAREASVAGSGALP